jgi:16S rRNA (cytosine967-C5)-methyltransferase
MIFYRPLLIQLIDTLAYVFQENKVAGKALETVFKKNKKWGSKDRKNFSEAFYEIVKWKIYLEHQIAPFEDPTLPLIATVYLCKSGYRFENGPGYSDEVSKAISVALRINEQVLLDFNLEPNLEAKHQLKLSTSSITTSKEIELNIRYSFPVALHNLILQENLNLQEFYINSQKVAPLFVRTNTHKISREELVQKFQQENYSVVADQNLKNGIKFLKKDNVFKSPLFKLGYFEVQDGGSQLISEFVLAEPGMTIVDACAGGGGKSLHLSNLTQNKGRIVSLDIYQWKLDELKVRARRNQCHNIETRLIVSTKIIKRLHGKADRVLLDVPCSGSGVFRRNPDSKYRLSATDLENLRALQRKILLEYSLMTHANGKLVYSTCSVFESENKKQIEWFLNTDKNWKLEEEKQIRVGENDYDGFYMARLSRV